MQPLHTMKVVARRTGLSPHVIRVWERRHGAVSPSRSQTRRRLYSEEEIVRLKILGEATKAGHGIGQIARLSVEDLLKLIEEDRPRTAVDLPSLPSGTNSQRDYVGDALEAVRALDLVALERLLNEAASEYGQLGLVQRVLTPLLERIGEAWQEGSLKVAHEHAATAAIRSFLGNFARGNSLPDTAPRLVVTTPPGFLHELGAILVALVASNQGWRVTYLGPCLPAEEIAGAVRQNQARAVALSMVYPGDDPHLESELIRLRQLLPEGAAILVGGRAATAYRPIFERIRAIEVADVSTLRRALEDLRARQPSVA
jgi:DNA-binding transcriptional MerR regulator/methylmalonyl-CoA mutase cobalamin-binding subunit